MKIYSDRITADDVREAFARAHAVRGADIWIESIRSWTPRARGYGTEVFAYSLHGKRASGHRAIGSYPLDGVARAASWEDWGWVIVLLYNIDENARIGFYNSRADFVSRVRQHPRTGSSLAFLGALDDINEYGGIT